MTTALFLGRFQPFHNAHLEDIKTASKENNNVIIAIGSSQYSDTKENPFSYEEIKEMITISLKKENISNYEIFPVTDIQDDQRWVNHVETSLPPFNIIYTGNKLTEELFTKANYKVIKVKMIENINGTTIRDKIKNNEEWESLVPEASLNIIKKINGIERIKNLN
jgi:nicotinamide-nucleotide adenylyltransferase